MTKRSHFAVLFSLTLAIAIMLVPMHVQAQKGGREKHLASQMVCMCGCSEILDECNPLTCATSAQMHKELAQMIAANDTDGTILQNFVQEYGRAVIAVPPSNSLAWYIPPMAFVLGLGIVVMVIRLWRHREVAAVTASPVPAAPTENSYAVPDSRWRQIRAQVDKDTED